MNSRQLKQSEDKRLSELLHLMQLQLAVEHYYKVLGCSVFKIRIYISDMGTFEKCQMQWTVFKMEIVCGTILVESSRKFSFEPISPAAPSVCMLLLLIPPKKVPKKYSKEVSPKNVPERSIPKIIVPKKCPQNKFCKKIFAPAAHLSVLFACYNCQSQKPIAQTILLEDFPIHPCMKFTKYSHGYILNKLGFDDSYKSNFPVGVDYQTLSQKIQLLFSFHLFNVIWARREKVLEVDRQNTFPGLHHFFKL